jgi:hypothetical protein
MIENRKIGLSLFGYSKKQTEDYLKELMTEKESAKAGYEELQRLKNESDSDRDRITRIFVKAQEKADSIVQDAERDIALRKKKAENEINKNIETLAKLKEELLTFRDRVYALLGDFDKDIGPADIADEKEQMKDEVPDGSLDIEFDKLDDDFKIDDNFETI